METLEARLERLKTMPYAEYLETPEWHEKRANVLRRAEYQCQICNSPHSLHVHHRTYENRGNERMEDLTVLCDECHQVYHERDSITYNLLSPQQLADDTLHCSGGGMPTGLRDLDKLLGGGLQKGELAVIAGAPGVGKTTLATNILISAAANKARCLLFCLEMGGAKLGARLLAYLSGVPAFEIRQAGTPEEQGERFSEALTTLNQLSIHFADAPSPSPRQLRHWSLKHKGEHGLDLVLVDYLQLMRDDEPNVDMYHPVASRVRALKHIARELNVSVVLVSQLRPGTVDRRGNKKPCLRDLGADSIDADADVVILLYRDVMHNPGTQFPNVAEICVAKNRNGPTGTVSAFFDEELPAFLNPETLPMDRLE